MHQRVGAACGAVFAVAFLVAESAGGYAGAVVGIGALTLFLPFLATLTSVLRRADGGGVALCTAFAAGLAAIVVKLVSAVPEIAERDLGTGRRRTRRSSASATRPSAWRSTRSPSSSPPSPR